MTDAAPGAPGPSVITIAGTVMEFAPGPLAPRMPIEELRRTPGAIEAGCAYVYYARRENGDIKIGSTYRLPTRLEDIARAHGPLRLLATHRGWWTEEKALHWHFRPYRTRPRQCEWYHPVLPL